MKELRKILISIDISEDYKNFLGYSKFITENLHAHGILFHVIPDVFGSYVPYDVRLDDVEKAVQTLRQNVESVLSDLSRKYGFEYGYDMGSPYLKIVEFIQNNDIDLVLVNGGEPGEEIGTQAHKVARKAAVPVLVYKTHSPKIEKILYTTDLSEKSEESYPLALDFKKRFGAKLTVFHVIEPITGYFDDTLLSGVPVFNLEELQKSAYSTMKDRFKECDDHVVEIGSSTADTIIEFARENGFDLIVMSTHGRGGLEKILLGSVTEKVVRFSHTPVLVSRIG